MPSTCAHTAAFLHDSPSGSSVDQSASAPAEKHQTFIFSASLWGSHMLLPISSQMLFRRCSAEATSWSTGSLWHKNREHLICSANHNLDFGMMSQYGPVTKVYQSQVKSIHFLKGLKKICVVPTLTSLPILFVLVVLFFFALWHKEINIFLKKKSEPVRTDSFIYWHFRGTESKESLIEIWGFIAKCKQRCSSSTDS